MTTQVANRGDYLSLAYAVTCQLTRLDKIGMAKKNLIETILTRARVSYDTLISYLILCSPTELARSTRLIVLVLYLDIVDTYLCRLERPK